MKKVTAFVGIARKKHTHYAVRQFLSVLESFGEVESEIVALTDCKLELCRGCKACFNKGESFCPLQDDRDLLIAKMMASDGVIFVSPNYSFNVSAIMKMFLDRLGFVFHRPCFFGKVFRRWDRTNWPFHPDKSFFLRIDKAQNVQVILSHLLTSIVVQGIYGGPKIVEYLDFAGRGLGFNVVKGSCVTALEPMNDKEQRKIDSILAAHSRRFHDRLLQPPYPAPSLFQLMIFRMSRTSIRLLPDKTFRDYTNYRDKGWLESDYFYPTHLNVFKRAVGSLFDYTTSRSAARV